MTDLETREATAGLSVKSIGDQIIRGTLTIAFIGVFWKMAGFLIYWLTNYYYGRGIVGDVFTGVFGRFVYLFFFASLLKLFKPAFMPLFAEQRLKAGEESAWKLASTIMNLLLLLGIAGAAVCFIFAPAIIGTIFAGFSAPAQSAAVVLLRWMLPGAVIMVFSIATLAILTSYKVFSYPPAADAAQKLCWAGALVVGLSILGLGEVKNADPAATTIRAMHIIGISFLVGCVAQVVILLYGMRKYLRRYRFGFPVLSSRRLMIEALWLAGAVGLFLAAAYGLNLCRQLPATHSLHIGADSRDFAILTVLVMVATLYGALLWQRGKTVSSIMGRFAMLTSPLFIGIIFGRYRTTAEAMVQSHAEEGQFSLVEYGIKVANLPTLLIGYAISIAMIPFLCDLATEDRRKELGHLVGRTLRFMLLFFIPLAVITIILSEPVMRLLWDHGQWTARQGRLAGLVLAILAITIPVLAIENVLMQSFFSLQRTVLPTVINIIFSILHVLALYIALVRFDLGGHAALVVCITIAVSRALKNLTLSIFLSRRLELMRRQRATSFGVTLLLICMAVALTTWATFQPVAMLLPLERYRPNAAGAKAKLIYGLIKCVRLGVPSLTSLVVFVTLCIEMEMEEFLLAMHAVKARLPWRKAKG